MGGDSSSRLDAMEQRIDRLETLPEQTARHDERLKTLERASLEQWATRAYMLLSAPPLLGGAGYTALQAFGG